MLTPACPDGRVRLILGGARPILDEISISRFERALTNLPIHATVITVEGADGAFCEGMDLNSLAQVDPREGALPLLRLARLLRSLASAPLPVVAMVDGPALGGGLGLACAADLVLATARARFGLPETLIGVIPAVVFPWVQRRAGLAASAQLALGMAPFAPQRAREVGIVDEVTDNLEATLERHHRRFARMDPTAMAAVKRLVAHHFSTPEGYEVDAVRAFYELLQRDSTQQRITRLRGGSSPWEEGSGP